MDFQRRRNDTLALGAPEAHGRGRSSGERTRSSAEGKSILFEGSQAALLDVDPRHLPFVTSSNCLSAVVRCVRAWGRSSSTNILAGEGLCRTRVGGGRSRPSSTTRWTSTCAGAATSRRRHRRPRRCGCSMRRAQARGEAQRASRGLPSPISTCSTAWTGARRRGLQCALRETRQSCPWAPRLWPSAAGQEWISRLEGEHRRHQVHDALPANARTYLSASRTRRRARRPHLHRPRPRRYIVLPAPLRKGTVQGTVPFPRASHLEDVAAKTRGPAKPRSSIVASVAQLAPTWYRRR